MNESESLPSAPQVEAAVLCCMVENPALFAGKAWEAQISREFFHVPAHAQLWGMVSSRHVGGKPVDPVSLREAIRDERPHGLTISDFSDVLLTDFDAGGWDSYVETLRDRYARRLAIMAGADVSSSGASGHDAVEMLRKAAEIASNALAGSSEVLTAKTSVAAFIRSLMERHGNGDMPGLSSGVPELDSRTGGLRKGELWVVGAKTSMGKSVLMLQIAAHALANGLRVAIFSLEMGADEVVGRLISTRYRISIAEILNPRTLSKNGLNRVRSAAEELQNSGLIVCDRADITIEGIAGHCQRLADMGGLDLVVVDYIQLITPPKVKGQNREQEVASISRGLKQLAKRIGCPVLTATQLNEQGQARESRAIEHDADAVLAITNSNPGVPADAVTFWKCRNGRRGDRIGVNLVGEFQRFDFHEFNDN